jgi:hypothetical protein
MRFRAESFERILWTARAERSVLITDAWPTALGRRPSPDGHGARRHVGPKGRTAGPPPHRPVLEAVPSTGDTQPEAARSPPRGEGGSSAGTWARMSSRQRTDPVPCGGRGSAALPHPGVAGVGRDSMRVVPGSLFGCPARRRVPVAGRRAGATHERPSMGTTDGGALLAPPAWSAHPRMRPCIQFRGVTTARRGRQQATLGDVVRLGAF